MGKSLKFDRVVDFDYLSAYEVIEKLVERFGVEDVQNALNEIAAQHSVQPTVATEPLEDSPWQTGTRRGAVIPSVRNSG